MSTCIYTCVHHWQSYVWCMVMSNCIFRCVLRSAFDPTEQLGQPHITALTLRTPSVHLGHALEYNYAWRNKAWSIVQQLKFKCISESPRFVLQKPCGSYGLYLTFITYVFLRIFVTKRLGSVTPNPQERPKSQNCWTSMHVPKVRIVELHARSWQWCVRCWYKKDLSRPSIQKQEKFYQTNILVSDS